jgi:hypothetical protein
MNKQSITLLAVLVLVNCSAFAAPTNEQLYQMLLEVKAEQGRLKQEATLAKKRESALQLELTRTQDELVLAKQQLNQSFEEPEELAIKEGFFMSAGGLYVRPLIDSGSSNLVSGGDPIRMAGNEMDYEPGFQVSLGYQATDNWDYRLKFKHFSAKEKATLGSDSLLPGLGVDLLTPQSQEYQLNYDVLDFEIGKQFALSDSVSLRLSGGLRYAALEDNYKTTTGLTTTKTENDFWGIGPRLTASPIWKPFHNNFRVFGNIGAAFLLGQYEIGGSPIDGIDSLGGNKEGFLTIVEAGAGIGYTFKTQLIDLDISAGYQFEHWLDSHLTDELLYRGFHGSYGTIGVKF